MAISNYIATGTPISGGDSVQGWLLYDGATALIVPQSSLAITSGETVSIDSSSYVEVDPDTVSLRNLNLQSKVIDVLTTESGAITVDSGYDALESVSILSVKLQDVSVDPSSEVSTVEKTDETAWGLGTVTVSAVTTDGELTIIPSDEEQIFTPTNGVGFTSVTVSPILIDEENNSAVPGPDSQTITPSENSFFKSFTVEATPLEDEITVTPSDVEQVFVPAGTLGYKGITVNAVPLAEDVTITPSLEEQTVTTTDGYWKSVTVGAVPLADAVEFIPTSEAQTADLGENLGLKGASVQAISIDTENNSYTPTASGATISPTEGSYFAEFTVDPVPTQTKTVSASDADQTILPDEGYFLSAVMVSGSSTSTLQSKEVTLTSTSQVITPDEGYTALSSVTVTAPIDEEITVQPTTEDQIFVPSGLGFAGVTVLGVAEASTSSIDSEAGFEVGEWVALALPPAVMSSALFKARPYYDNGKYFLGKTYAAGSYMAIAVYSQCGKVVATVYLNDIVNRYYIESLGIENPFPSNGVVNLSSAVDSTEIEWSDTTLIEGNNNEILVSDEIEMVEGATLTIKNATLSSEGLSALFSGEGYNVTFNNCTFTGFDSIDISTGTYRFISCSFDCEVNISEDAEVAIDRCKLTGEKGVTISGDSCNVIIRATTFNCSDTAITIEGSGKVIRLEGNIFKGTGTQVSIPNELSNYDTLHIIGSVKIDSLYYIVSGNDVEEDEEGIYSVSFSSNDLVGFFIGDKFLGDIVTLVSDTGTVEGLSLQSFSWDTGAAEVELVLEDYSFSAVSMLAATVEDLTFSGSVGVTFYGTTESSILTTDSYSIEAALSANNGSSVSAEISGSVRGTLTIGSEGSFTVEDVVLGEPLSGSVIVDEEEFTL